MRPGTSAATARRAGPMRCLPPPAPARSRRAPAFGQASQPNIRDAALVIEVGPERRGPRGGQPVGPSTVPALERLDEPLPLEAAQRLVQAPLRPPDARPGPDVTTARVPVLP